MVGVCRYCLTQKNHTKRPHNPLTTTTTPRSTEGEWKQLSLEADQTNQR